MPNKTRLGFVLYVLVVIVASLVSTRSLSTTPGSLDKVGHFLAYAIMAFWGLNAFSSRRASISVILFSLCLGVVLEYFQSFVSERDPSIADGIANFAGVLIGAVAYFLKRDSSRL